MTSFGASQPDRKMMIYKIHQLRVLIAIVLFAAATVLLLAIDNSQRCVRVSVTVRRPWRPTAKKTRLVQALVPERSVRRSEPFIGSWFFRTKIILPPVYSSSPPDYEETDVRDDGDPEDDEEESDELGYGADEYYSEDEDMPENKIFEDGDFDYGNQTALGGGYPELDVGAAISRIFHALERNHSGTVPSNSSQKAEQLVQKNESPRRIGLVNVEGVPIVEDGIYWSDELERRAPKGATDEEVESALKKLRSLNVQRVEPPTWNRCGRPKNQFVVFEDGSKACARYRAPHQYLVQGEVLSFYLSRLLGIHNVPAVSLAAVRPGFEGIWSREAVKKSLMSSKWEFNTTVALIQWIDNLERDRMPLTLLSSLENKEPLSAKSSSLLKLTTRKLTELLQWSDLIVFDYITGNYDRVASMQDAADKEGKPSILRETVHNLVRSKSTGGLWLIDNESGLLDSYSLLYGRAAKDSRFIRFHRHMLEATCLFRRRTAERVRLLHTSRMAGQILLELVTRAEPLFTSIKREKEVARRLQQRITEVHKHIEQCNTQASLSYHETDLQWSA